MGGVIGEKVGMGRDGPELDPPESTNPATGLTVWCRSPCTHLFDPEIT